MNKQERRRQARANDPAVQARKAQKTTNSSVSNFPGSPSPGDMIATGGMIPTNSTAALQPGSGSGQGWGLGLPDAKPAGGQRPSVNPWMQPKAAGLNVTSQTFPSNYYVEWNLTTWRFACDQAIKMGYTMSYATLASWAFECSAFIQSMFTALSAPLASTPFYVKNGKGEIMDDWTEELCNKEWQQTLNEEILYSKFWGFTGLNFDPWKELVYKYPMQEIDPINQLVKAGTYDFYNGTRFEDHPNLIFVQPSQNYEKFLGWMQPITRAFILMNTNKNSWIQAGRKLAFPIMTVGYPQDDAAVDPMSNQINPYKLQAEDVVANADPSKGMVYPYTTDNKGNIIKSLEIEFEKTGTGAKAHDIFTDFNESEKNEIREMLLGGTLTADAGTQGSRALGEVQERKFDSQNAANIEFVVRRRNKNVMPKMRHFYKNLPPDAWFDIQRAKPMTLADMQALSGVVTQNGKRLTTQFFVSNGIAEEFIEDAPDPVSSQPTQPGKDPNVKPLKKDFKMAEPEKSFFGFLKKKQY